MARLAVGGKTQTDLDVESTAAEQERINQEALAYLAETDWYITRQTETHAVVPAEVLMKRRAARDSVQ